MAPALQFHGGVAEFGEIALPGGKAARMNRAAWRQALHGFAVGTPKGPKSAPQHRDFGAGKVGIIK